MKSRISSTEEEQHCSERSYKKETLHSDSQTFESLMKELINVLLRTNPGTMTSLFKSLLKVTNNLDVTLDPDTSNPYLILSDDGKQVRCGGTKQNLPDNSERFNNCICVLGKEGFSSGRFYYEVQVSGKTRWDLGVVRESVNRKGKNTLTPQNGFWTVGLRNGNQYKALAGPSVSLSLRENLQKVGVFVDYEEGLVSFYDVEARSHIYSFTGQSFTEKLYPYFSPCVNDGGKNSAPLIITPVTHDD
uniref:B30.2/SPRY domain-containing protein n=1 Tax=Astyanax mexicanus TaxID=7994 RepID=A0A3B1K058_ASTMX